MAEVTGMTAARMQEIADASVVSGAVDGTGHLKLTTSGGSTIDAGDVIGPTGPTGPQGPVAPAPTGAIMMFAANSTPSGWVFCNGAALSRTTYATLFGVIGTTYGAGDGSTTFNVPDMRSKFPRHSSSPLGGTGGGTTHDHGIDGGSTPAVAHINFITNSPNPTIDVKRVGSASWNADLRKQLSTGTVSSGTGLTSGAEVVGQTDTADHTPPYLNVLFIIKT